MSGLLKLKSVFSPTNTKFQENQSDLTTFDSKFDDGLNIPIKSNLLNLDSKFDDGLNIPIKSNLLDSSFDSIFDDGVKSFSELYIQNQPQDKFDTKFNYNESSLIEQTYGFGVDLNKPTLDSLLRGRVYNQTQFSQNFTNDTLFVSPENHPYASSPFLSDSFDPRAPFAKQGTLYFNTNFRLTGNSFMNTNDLNLNNDIFIENNPQDKFDTKLDYTTNSEVNVTFGTPGIPPTGHPNVPGNPIQMSVSPLDNVLRGPVYEQVRFSADSTITDNRQFVNDINDVEGNHPFKTESFDPRAGLGELIKDRTIYQNINNSFRKPSRNPEVTFGTAGIQSPYQGGDIFNSIHGGNYGGSDPVVDLSTLGVSFFNGENSDKNLSWESLYNSNHTPKENPKWQGGNLEALHYGSIVNRETLDINYNVGGDGGKSATRYGEKSGLIGAFSRRSNKGKGEPYIVSDIGDDSKTKGGRFVPNRRANADTDRILTFMKSDEGLSFILQQNAQTIIKNTVVRQGNDLVRIPQRFNTIYNPLSTLEAQKTRLLGQGPNIYVKKGGSLLVTLASEFGGNIPIVGGAVKALADILLPEKYGTRSTSFGGISEGGDAYNVNDTFTAGPQPGFLDGFAKLVGGGFSAKSLIKKEAEKAKQSFLAKLNPRSADNVDKVTKGDKMTLAPMIRGDGLQELDKDITLFGVTATIQTLAEEVVGVNPESKREGMPFYFKDLRDDNYIFFRAFIEGLTENISPSYASHQYIGRSEPVYTYERAEREISFTLKLVAQTKAELLAIYAKMDRLTSMCYPEYVDDIYGNRMKPPLSKLRYGELYGKDKKELMGYIKSISYAVDQSSTYDVDQNTRVPKHVTATIGYQVIHDKAPRLGTKFYGINQ